MPDLPQPYQMRDWQAVAQNYDTLVFDLDAVGEYFPLASVFENTVNYPAHPGLAMQSYVGTNSPPGKEAINVLPAVIGASLAGIDKSNQNGINWPLYCEEYFNRRPEENIYLNGPQSSSGNDWWYETMPNVFFYQLNYLYPNTGDFNYQVTTVADQWLAAVEALGGSTTPWEIPYMNYRAFNLSTMMPREDGVKQPEAAGAIAWILYQAHQITGDEKYRIGAELALEFLSNWDENPSYEIQLPYGVYAAARMNAELGTQYDINKMINWCFDRGPLRGWGVITGDWDGQDMDGLIGEVNAATPDYVFNMNSLEHVGALVPALRYDDRYAVAIAKWVLNVANATRYYYPQFLPEEMQDNNAWSEQYDPTSAIAYEALRQKDNGPYGTGDAMGGGWAETNLGLYGSSHIGILGAIVRQTNVEGVLQLNLLATDYYHQDAYPTWLYYNPFEQEVEVVLNISDTKDIYDAISNQVIITGASQTAIITLPPKGAILAVELPQGSQIDYQLNTAFVDDIAIDYNAGQTVTNYPPRIKALKAKDSLALINTTFHFYCSAEDRETSDLQFNWSINDNPVSGSDIMEWQVQESVGFYWIKCRVEDAGNLWVSDSLQIEVVETINYPPYIEEITAENQIIDLSASTNIECLAGDANEDDLTYTWSASQGNIQGSGASIVFEAPNEQSSIYVVCAVNDPLEATVKDSVLILVRDSEFVQTGDLIAHYLFAGNAADATGNGHDGSISNSIFVEDMFDDPDEAIKLNISTSKVIVQNDEQLNFREGFTLTYWLNISQLYDRESYPVSHGNWTTRWKTSITDHHLRFTLNGSEGTIDVDAQSDFEENRWYHVAAIYNGMDCLVFVDGQLEGFTPYSGLINTTSYDLVLGQSLPDQTGFNYSGLIDNLRLYNYGISYPQLREIYEGELSEVAEDMNKDVFNIYPNPAKNKLVLNLRTEPSLAVSFSMFSLSGQKIIASTLTTDYQGIANRELDLSHIKPGAYILKITSQSAAYSKKLIIRN